MSSLRKFRREDLRVRRDELAKMEARDLAIRQSYAMQERGIYGFLVDPMSYAIYNEQEKLTYTDSRFAKTIFTGDATYE